MLGILAASRKSSSPALRLALCLEPVRASVASVFRDSQLAVPPKKRCALPLSPPSRQPLDFAEVFAKLAAVLDKPRSARSLEEEFGVDLGVATTEMEYTEVPNGGGKGGRGLQRLGGHAHVQRILRTPSRMPWSYHSGARDESAGRSDDSSP